MKTTNQIFTTNYYCPVYKKNYILTYHFRDYLIQDDIYDQVEYSDSELKEFKYFDAELNNNVLSSFPALRIGFKNEVETFYHNIDLYSYEEHGEVKS
jgi:hypothetical protein